MSAEDALKTESKNFMDIWIAVISSILSLAVGFVAGIYLPKKFRQDDRRPIISLGPFQKQFNLFEISNHGGDILELDVEIKWLKDGKEESRLLTRFLNANDSPLRDKPHLPGSLKKGETKKVCECPLYSDDGNVKVYVRGRSIDQESYANTFSLKNEAKK